MKESEKKTKLIKWITEESIRVVAVDDGSWAKHLEKIYNKLTADDLMDIWSSLK